MTDCDRALCYLLVHGKCSGPSGGVEPFLLEDSLQMARADFGCMLHQMKTLGLLECEAEGTTAFNDPITLKGVRLLNVYLTEAGWELARVLQAAAVQSLAEPK